LSTALFNTPLQLDSSSDFIAELHDYFKKYLLFVEDELENCVINKQISKSEKDDFLNIINISCINLVGVLDNHRKGNIISANTLFEDIMKALGKIFNQQTFYNSFNKYTNFYRIRQDEIKDENKYAIFHIPFNLRKRVANLRFNAPGFPCLYCANNLETAWVECRKPGSDSFLGEKKFLNSAIFSISEELSFLDISYRDITELKKASISRKANLVEYINYLQLFPLIVSLHCKIIYDKSEWVSFHYEYLLPTMFMHWFITDKETKLILPSNLNAIKYSSVENFDTANHYNIVSPAKFNTASLYCSVLERIFLTKYQNHYHKEVIIDKIDSSFINSLESKLKGLL
jgi:RES domain